MKTFSLLTLFASLVLANFSMAMGPISSDEVRALQWLSMSNDSAEMAQVMLASAAKIAAQANPQELHFSRVERSTTPDREFYRLHGMRIVGGDMVLGNFTLLIVKTAVREYRRTSYRYEVYYHDDRNDDLPPLPPRLVRS